MKKSTIILIAIAVLLVGGGALYYFLYEQQKKEIDAWSFVPETAALVYETDRLMPVWQETTASPLWKNLSAIPAFDSIAQHIGMLDSLSSLKSFFENRRVLISMHVVAHNAFDFTYFFKLNNAGEFSILKDVLDKLSAKPYMRHEIRTYNSFQINELIDDRNGKRFSYIVHHNIFAGSFTPYLIEDIIRNIDTDFEQYSFSTANPKLHQLPRMPDDEGNVYLNMRKIPLLLSMFAGKGFQHTIKPLEYLAKSAFLDVDITEQQLLLNGFSMLPDGEQPRQTLLHTFRNQSPQELGMKTFIPERTAILFHMTFSDPESWQEALYQYQQSYVKDLSLNSLAPRQRMTNEGFDPALFFQTFEKEAGVLTLESVDASQPDKLMIIGVNDTTQVSNAIERLHALDMAEAREQAYEENFGSYRIREIQHKEFPAALLGPVAQGFGQCFYVFTEGYWLMANSVRALKRVLLDQEAENTWNRSVAWNRFLETTVDQANLSMMVNTSRAWPLLLNSLSPEWRQYAQEHAEQFKKFERIAIQFSRNEEEFYTSLEVDYTSGQQNPSENRQFQTTQQVFLDNPAATKPFVVKNYQNQQWEMLVQDDSNYLYLASSSGQVLWKDSLSGPLVGDIQQIDFFKDGNFQYVFATEKAVHIIDRNGDAVEGYPLYMPEDVVIQYLAVIDYDNSKNYRFLVADHTGKLWMYNQYRENLEGWNPRPLNTPLATNPTHVRIRDRDFIVAVQQDGTINLLNRKGQLYGGFPISLDTDIKSPVYIAQNSELGNSVITTVTTQGELVAFNFLGNTVQREQLYRPTANTRFSLCLDALGKTFLVVRKDADRLGILDREGNVLLEKAYISAAALTSNMLDVQYYDFGAGNKLFAVTDKIQEFAYLFDGKASLIKDRPVESAFGVGVLFFESEGIYHIYRSYANECSVISFTP